MPQPAKRNTRAPANVSRHNSSLDFGSKRTRWALLIILGLSIIGLIGFCYLGTYARPTHDDYYFSRADGTLPGTDWDFGINGRVGSQLLYGIFYSIPHYYQVIPAVSILIIFLSLFAFLRAILKYLIKPGPSQPTLLAAVLAGVLSLATILLLPSIYASVYWLAAIVPHSWAFCLVLVYAAALISRYKSAATTPWKDMALFILLPLFIGILYESTAILLVLMSAVYLYLAYRRKRGLLRPAWFGLVASLASVAVLLFSPGALKRRHWVAAGGGGSPLKHLNGYPADLWNSWVHLIPYHLLSRSLLIVLFAFGFLLAVFCIKKSIATKRAALYGAGVIVVTVVINSVNVTAIWFGLGDPLMVRSYFITACSFAIAALLLGAIAGMVARQLSKTPSHILSGLAVVIIIAGLVNSLCYFPYVKSFASQMRGYAHTWEKRDATIRKSLAHGQCRIAITGLNLNGSNVLSKSPNYWLNHEMDAYYYINYGHSEIEHGTKVPCGLVRSDASLKSYFYY